MIVTSFFFLVMPGLDPGIHAASSLHGLPGIGELRDAVVRTAMPGNDA